MGEFQPAGMNKRVDYTTILFLQVNRVNTAQTVEERALSIKNLESLLYYYILNDPKGASYTNTMEEIKKKVKTKYAHAKQANPTASTKILEANKLLDLSDLNYKQLICLIGSVGLLPKADLEYDEAKDADYLDGNGPDL